MNSNTFVISTICLLILIISASCEDEKSENIDFSVFSGIWMGHSKMLPSGECLASDTNWITTEMDVDVENDGS